MGWACRILGSDEKFLQILIEKPEERKQLGRFRGGCDYNNQMCHNGIGCEDVDWIHLAQDRN
jgi:hypothetical protein